MNPKTELANENLVNPGRELVDNSEATIGAVNSMVNTIINTIQ